MTLALTPANWILLCDALLRHAHDEAHPATYHNFALELLAAAHAATAEVIALHFLEPGLSFTLGFFLGVAGVEVAQVEGRSVDHYRALPLGLGVEPARFTAGNPAEGYLA